MPPSQTCCWARVYTSTGVIGLGETYYLPGAVERVIHDLAADLFLGEPAGAISQLWSAFFSCTNFFGFAGAEMRALSALDMALWDALGQTVGLPVYQLLGGACRQTVPAYNTCVNAGANRDWDRALEEPAALAAELRDHGYFGMKVWPWDRFAPQLHARGSTGPAGWSAMGPPGSYLSLTDLAAGLSVLEAARDRVGHSFELLLEGHSRWDVNMAIRLCRAVEPIGVLWAEDVCQPDSAEDLARLARETRVPQAVSERLISALRLSRGAPSARRLTSSWWTWPGPEALARPGGWRNWPRTYHLPFAPHDCTGPVTALANLHLAISQPNCSGSRGRPGLRRRVLPGGAGHTVPARPRPAHWRRPGLVWARHFSRFPSSGRCKCRVVEMTASVDQESKGADRMTATVPAAGPPTTAVASPTSAPLVDAPVCPDDRRARPRSGPSSSSFRRTCPSTPTLPHLRRRSPSAFSRSAWPSKT